MDKLLAVFCAVLMLIRPAYALMPTPTPMPHQQGRAMLGGITAEAYYYDEWQVLCSHMLNARSGGMYADGILAFVSLETFVQSEEIPTVRLSEDFDIRIAEPTDVDSYACAYKIYRMTEAGLEECPELEPVWQALDEGLYLITIPHSLSRGEDYYSGMCILWLEV